MIRLLLIAALMAAPAAAQPANVLVVTADGSDYVLAAGGTIAGMIEKGATARLIRVTNDEKDSWDLPPEETARRAAPRGESGRPHPASGGRLVRILGRSLGGVSDGLRDR
jgi:hypothetical protein